MGEREKERAETKTKERLVVSCSFGLWKTDKVLREQKQRQA